MTGNGKYLSIAAISVAAVGLILVLWLQVFHRAAPEGAGESGPPPVAAGKMAAPFTLRDLNGKTVSLRDLRGKVVFLNVWATWCGPCREEMPSIEALYDDFKRYPNFVILAVSQDTGDPQQVASYIAQNGYHFEVLLDPQNKVGDAYDVGGVPETFIIDRDGRIVAHHMGAFNWSRADFRAALKELIENRTQS
jgi:cytochrome c biogenesis protein CcmG/thiol:disulfide interchange protein DsbE